MHTVIETESYLRSAKQAGMNDIEMKATVDLISANPAAGDLIVGSGGCRKVRIAKQGGGKSGGYRVVTYYFGERHPVSLLAVLSKGSADSFSAAQVNAMAKATAIIAKSFGPRAASK